MTRQATEPHRVSLTRHRVNYSEVDQMGVVYHARYLVWLDVARTEHLRLTGPSYRELEEQGFRLAVSELQVRYRAPARYDDPIRIRCWVREAKSRLVSFGYAVEHDTSGALLVTATTDLVVLDADFHLARLPGEVLAALHVTPDPVRL